jgi:hypothetical protein
MNKTRCHSRLQALNKTIITAMAMSITNKNHSRLKNAVTFSIMGFIYSLSSTR